MILSLFLLVVFSAILHASWNLVTKKHAGNYSIIYLSFVGGSLLTAYPAYHYWPQDSAVILNNWHWITVACLAHAVYGLVLSYTYGFGDISTLYPIVRGSGVAIAVVVSVWLMAERLNAPLAAGAGMVIAGITVLSYKRNRKETQPLGVILALTCGCLIATYTVVDKVLVAQIHPLTILFILQLTSGLLFMPYVLKWRFTELKKTLLRKWKPTLFVCGAATLSYTIILYVFQVAEVSRVATVRESAVVFGAIGGYLIFKESVILLRLIGVLAVAIGIVLVKIS